MTLWDFFAHCKLVDGQMTVGRCSRVSPGTVSAKSGPESAPAYKQTWAAWGASLSVSGAKRLCRAEASWAVAQWRPTKLSAVTIQPGEPH